MQFSKVAISLLLLLTYSFGSAHNLIPHNQELDLQNHIPATHHHYSLNDKNSSNHDLILHQSHFDESLFDLVVCFISETDHPVKKCIIQHYMLTETNDVFPRDPVKANIACLLLMVFTEFSIKKSISVGNTNSGFTHLSPLLKSSPHRGPPSSVFLPIETIG